MTAIKEMGNEYLVPEAVVIEIKTKGALSVKAALTLKN